MTATNSVGQTQTKQDGVTLETEIATYENLTVHQQFVGVVADTNHSVRVTATSVQDSQGNPIASGSAETETATLQIADRTYTVTVEDGTIDARIDPTKLADDTPTGNVTVTLVEATTQGDTGSVQLVHEARGLSAGYQLTGTPMDADKVLFQDVNDATTYDPTAERMKWTAPAATQAGEGYYVHGESDAARIGYVFASSGALRSTKLHRGYNLVAATPDLNQQDGVKVTDDLGEGVTVGGDVKVYVRDQNVDLTDPSGNADVTGFDRVNGAATVNGYEGYFVYVGSGEEIRVITAEGYDPAQGS